jgi:hypothetical protein
MSDPTGLRDEAVVTLNERPSASARSSVTGADGASATTLLRGESGTARFSTTLPAALLRNMHCRPFAEPVVH